MPWWMYILPSGLMTNSPSTPIDPAVNVLWLTATPVTLVPLRWPLRCLRSSQLKSSAPRSSASLMYALVTFGARAVGLRDRVEPNCDPVTGALSLRIST